ncbi:MAG TPA: hypothetical protein VFC19_27280 [Candidatus Limnocylindrales bacterium]|nr:hypothetical protein [Candidatus Limnocylindrales bacterium]
MENLWMREMGGAEAALEDMSPATRLGIMHDAIEHVVFHSLSPLSSFLSADALRLVRSAIDAASSDPAWPAHVETLFSEMGALINEQSSVNPIILSAAMDLVANLVDEPRSSDVVDVLFNCYDATMQTQGMGRVATLKDQIGNQACWNVIRHQKDLLGIES